MTAISDSVLSTVIEELQTYNKTGITIGPETEIAGDLDMDSVAQMDLLFALEEAFGISIPLNALSDVRSVADLVAAVAPLVAEQRGAAA